MEANSVANKNKKNVICKSQFYLCSIKITGRNLLGI